MKRYSIEIPAVLESLGVVSSFTKSVLEELPDLPDRERLVHDLTLVATEGVTNAIRHGKMPDLLVRLEYLLVPRGITISVTDYGDGFDLDSVRPPDFEGFPVGGFGIYIMKSIMDEVRYEKSTEGNTLILTKNWDTVAATGG